jgi:hypothetical protein
MQALLALALRRAEIRVEIAACHFALSLGLDAYPRLAVSVRVRARVARSYAVPKTYSCE